MNNRDKRERGKDFKWKVITTISLTGTVTLGALKEGLTIPFTFYF